ncbi:type VI secretion system baseplate subunit TssF [Massilia sp. CCM 9210]|uniref:type VI secretion system baseplate subunit TssF n=1 Tax=Massilia scottii TaxID=3057166 RepID=UPI00279698E4|nr:type VI secretion system baseplate subunit TssF [Massilia sp. CCM 9210]MDQ1812067.1 type VI secretion system baseplate subunit TssF [Massilia sp. CCM 9210]
MQAPQITGNKLKSFYEAELSALRTEAAAFATNHPAVAGSLGLGRQRGPSTDAQVEMLIQSFAFLTGRLQYQLEQDQAALPNSLLSLLYPHLEAPLPSMLIAQISVKPDGANFAKEQLLQRGRYVKAGASDEQGRKVDCRLRTCYETPLLPLHVAEVQAMPASAYSFLRGDGAVHAVIRVRVRADRAGALQGAGPARLRFYIDNTEQHAYQLFEALALNLAGLAVYFPRPGDGASYDGAAQLHLKGGESLRWLGMGDDEAMLEPSPHTHPGYRLLQEYFLFPEKFLFFDVANLSFNCTQDSFDLLFLLDMPMQKTTLFTPQVLRLNCVPLVNLFVQRIDPVALDHRHYEYHLLGDLDNHRHCEIYALKSLESIRPDGSVRPIAPYFTMDEVDAMEQQDYFYILRREASMGAGMAGSELFVSFLDSRFDLTQLDDETVGGRALCTNRRLPEKLMSGDVLQLEGAGPVDTIRVLTRPTPHQSPAQVGARPWALVSQLALNHLSLSDRPEALCALKEILLLHTGADKRRSLKQIDGIVRMGCRQIMRHVGSDGWRGFVRCIQVDLEMDRNHFTDASPVLFHKVLRHFLTLYAAVNTVVEVSLETQDIKGNRKQWQPMSGARPIL